MARNIAVRKQKAGSRNLLASKHGGKQYSIQKTLKNWLWKCFHKMEILSSCLSWIHKCKYKQTLFVVVGILAFAKLALKQKVQLRLMGMSLVLKVFYAV